MMLAKKLDMGNRVNEIISILNEDDRKVFDELVRKGKNSTVIQKFLQKKIKKYEKKFESK